MNVTTSARRHLLTAAACTALVALAPRGVRAAMGPNDKFDLLVRNANVLDPSQNLNGKRDIGIRYGVIEAIDASIAPDRAQRVLDASGKLVTPGLIDLHAHTYPYGSAIGIPADELIAHQCTTTVVSAGDAGANNIAGFRRIGDAGRAHAPVRVRAHRGGRTGRLSGARAVQHRLRAGRRHRPRHRRERRHRARREGAHERERDRAPRAGAAEARDRRLREVRRAGQADGAHRRRAVARADVADPRPDAPRRRVDALLFRRAQHRRRGDQHRAGRPPAAGGAGRQAARRRVRRRPRRRQLRLHDRRGGHSAGCAARHHLVGHPRVLRQHARACRICRG